MKYVALFTRAWIEMVIVYTASPNSGVALFTRAWIEISGGGPPIGRVLRRPLYEGVD